MLQLTLRVDEQSLLAGDRVRADDGVSVSNRLATLDATLLDRSRNLLNTRVDSLEAMKSLLEERAQSVVSLSGVAEQSIASCLRLVEDVEESCARRLLLI